MVTFWLNWWVLGSLFGYILTQTKLTVKLARKWKFGRDMMKFITRLSAAAADHDVKIINFESEITRNNSFKRKLC